jgi:hypothetical protein
MQDIGVDFLCYDSILNNIFVDHSVSSHPSESRAKRVSSRSLTKHL